MSPTYPYKCLNCNFEFDNFQSITSPPLKKCPECKKNKLKKQITGGAGLIFKKGCGGFYCKDYSDKPTKTVSTNIPPNAKKGPANLSKNSNTPK
jgi:putative FmdB family regulatory protein